MLKNVFKYVVIILISVFLLLSLAPSKAYAKDEVQGPPLPSTSESSSGEGAKSEDIVGPIKSPINGSDLGKGIKAKAEVASTNTSTAGFDLGDLNNYQKDPSSPGKLKDKAEVVLGIIRTVGIVGSVVALIIIGIKYMLGSIEQKTQYKETMKPYLIGCLLIFSGSFLPELIYQIVKGIKF